MNKHNTHNMAKAAIHVDIAALINIPTNAKCADCRKNGVSHASVSLGIYLCASCAELHEGLLGPEISDVRHLGALNWTGSDIAFMRSMGNERAKLIYEFKLSLEDEPITDEAKLEHLILAKYKHKTYRFPVEFLEPSGETETNEEESDLIHFAPVDDLSEEELLEGIPSIPRRKKMSRSAMKQQVLQIYAGTSPPGLRLSVDYLSDTQHTPCESNFSRSWGSTNARDLTSWDPFSLEDQGLRTHRKNKSQILALYSSGEVMV